MALDTADFEAWKREYEAQGIPSSSRANPSGSVVSFLQFLRAQGITSGNALDIGCGRGRNALLLAQSGFTVTAIDFVPGLISTLTDTAKERGLQICAHCHDVSTLWPVESSSIAVAIDAFCFKHQIPESIIRFYSQEIMRVLAPGAFWMLSLAGVDDGYYSQFLASSPEPERNIIVDPGNSIVSILYTKDDVPRIFDQLTLVGYEHKTDPSAMHGTMYDRSTHVFYFQKPLPAVID